MDKETEQWYEHQFDMFNLEGWKELIEQAKDIRDNASKIGIINDANQLFFVKGQLDILNWLIGWENKVNEVFKDLKDAQEAL